MRGIILSGGTGSRLYPITKVLSKQLLNVYDKPMIYYPLSTLMLSGIREICIVTTLEDSKHYMKLLGNGNQFGVTIKYFVQRTPEGIPQALMLTKDFIEKRSCCLILGDNLFYGPTLGTDLKKYTEVKGAHIFGYQVQDPERYGVVQFSALNKIESLEEKPIYPKSNFAITGLYYFDETVTERTSSLKKSRRGEYEIIDVLHSYQNENLLEATILPRGTAWLDTGNPESLHDASAFIKVIQERQGVLISSPEEIAFRNNWISEEELRSSIKSLGHTRYAKYLAALLHS